jgi:hypothetical protein
MTDGARCKSNKRLRSILYPMVRAHPVGYRFKVKELSRDLRLSILMPHRDVMPMTLGCLLRECPEVKPLGNGVWERISV